MDPFSMYGEGVRTGQPIASVQALFPEPRDLELDFAADSVSTASLAPIDGNSVRGGSYGSLFAGPGPSLPGIRDHAFRQHHPSNFMAGDLPRGPNVASFQSWDRLPLEPDLPPIRGFPNGAPAQLAFNTGPGTPAHPSLNIAPVLEDNFHLPPLDIEGPRIPSLKVEDRDLASKHSLLHAERGRKEREKAEKLKEKNKRAQRKFRQRQKDKQESAEKMAADLAVELDKLRAEMDTVTHQKAEAEQRLHQANIRLDEREILNEEEEPTFTPAGGWCSYHPRKGMVLVATTNKKLTHTQLMKLSLQDVCKLLTESHRCLSEELAELDRNPDNTASPQRLQALVNERHALMSYIAINKPAALYQIATTKMSDPLVEKAEQPRPEFWEKILESISLSEDQVRNMLEARRTFLRKIDKLIQDRDAITKAILTTWQTFQRTSSDEIAQVSSVHLDSLNLLEAMRQTFELIHRSNSYYLARFCYGDCLTTQQFARVVTQAWPYQINVFLLSSLISKGRGAPNHIDLILAERLREEIGPSPIDLYVEAFPASQCDNLRDSQKLEASSHIRRRPEPEFYSNRVFSAHSSSVDTHDVQQTSQDNQGSVHTPVSNSGNIEVDFN